MKRIVNYELCRLLKLENLDVMVVKNKKFGDYTSNVLMKEKLSPETVLSQLAASELFESVEIKNGHINIWLSKKIPEVVFPDKFNINHRMKDIYERLTQEGYLANACVVKPWDELLKLCVLLYATIHIFKTPTENELAKIIQSFESIDSGYIYRNKQKNELSGIRFILGHCLLLLER